MQHRPPFENVLDEQAFFTGGSPVAIGCALHRPGDLSASFSSLEVGRALQSSIEHVLGLLRIVTSRSREFENRTYARQSVFPDWRLLYLRCAMSQFRVFRLEVASAAQQMKLLHAPREHNLRSCGNTLWVPARSLSPRILPPSSQSYPFLFGRVIRAQDFEAVLWHISCYNRLFPMLTYKHGITPANRYILFSAHGVRFFFFPCVAHFSVCSIFSATPQMISKKPGGA